MSTITENTVIISPKYCEETEADLRKYGCSGIRRVFKNSKYAVYVFDCNGDSPWDIKNADECQMPYDKIIALETNYGDSDGLWTRFPSRKRDAKTTIHTWLRRKVTKEELQIIRKKIKYSW